MKSSAGDNLSQQLVLTQLLRGIVLGMTVLWGRGIRPKGREPHSISGKWINRIFFLDCAVKQQQDQKSAKYFSLLKVLYIKC